MANPRLENGYMRIANEIINELGKVSLNGTEYKVVLCVLRFTYGFNRKSHRLSTSFIAHWGNCSIPSVKRALKNLQKTKIIIVLNADDRGTTSELTFNKNFEMWGITGIKNDTSIRNNTSIKSDTAPVSEMIPQPVSEMIPKIIQKERTNLNNNIVEQNSTICFCKEIIEFLNAETGKNFKWQTQSTKRHINARLAEGFTLENFKNVISHKTAEWKGTDMEKYLRPETLFGTKFEGYLNSIPAARAKPPELEETEIPIDLWSE